MVNLSREVNFWQILVTMAYFTLKFHLKCFWSTVVAKNINFYPNKLTDFYHDVDNFRLMTNEAATFLPSPLEIEVVHFDD